MLLLLATLLAASPARPATPAAPGGTAPAAGVWKLVWSDEFRGAQLDPAKWKCDVTADGGGNHELQYYTARLENVFVRHGHLVLEARREHYTGPEGTREFTSGKVTTYGRAAWQYGRIEVRARLPRGRGLWPAIWLLPVSEVYGSWPRSGEIDLMESLGQAPANVFGTLHYTDAQGAHAYTGKDCNLPRGTFADGFHVFALEWDAHEFRWCVDGACYQTQTRWQTAAAPYPAPFNRKFFLILNLAVGGDLPGPPDAATAFPQRFEIDYVRVYQRAPAPASR